MTELKSLKFLPTYDLSKIRIYVWLRWYNQEVGVKKKKKKDQEKEAKARNGNIKKIG